MATGGVLNFRIRWLDWRAGNQSKVIIEVNQLNKRVPEASALRESYQEQMEGLVADMPPAATALRARFLMWAAI